MKSKPRTLKTIHGARGSHLRMLELRVMKAHHYAVLAHHVVFLLTLALLRQLSLFLELFGG
jgi:hypothetical protein